jgi:hypothetical protein
MVVEEVALISSLASAARHPEAKDPGFCRPCCAPNSQSDEDATLSSDMGDIEMASGMEILIGNNYVRFGKHDHSYTFYVQPSVLTCIEKVHMFLVSVFSCSLPLMSTDVLVCSIKAFVTRTSCAIGRHTNSRVEATALSISACT